MKTQIKVKHRTGTTIYNFSGIIIDVRTLNRKSPYFKSFTRFCILTGQNAKYAIIKNTLTNQYNVASIKSGEWVFLAPNTSNAYSIGNSYSGNTLYLKQKDMDIIWRNEFGDTRLVSDQTSPNEYNIADIVKAAMSEKTEDAVNTDKYIYAWVRKDLSEAQKAIQLAHAIQKFGYNNIHNPNIVLLGVDSEKDFEDLRSYLNFLKMKHYTFEEPDIGNQQTALVTQIINADERHVFAKFKLLNGK